MLHDQLTRHVRSLARGSYANDAVGCSRAAGRDRQVMADKSLTPPMTEM